MAKKKKQQFSDNAVNDKKPSRLIKSSINQTLVSTSIYFFIASLLTFPLIFRMNSSIYGPYDHITTDLFATIYHYFWWVKESIFVYGRSPFDNHMLSAPFGVRMMFVNLTGFVHLPITLIFGHIFSRNFAILFNLIVSGLGMFLLIRHITKSAAAGFIAGLIFAFCPNMLVRSYTTYESTQVQWIPLYTLYLIKFIEIRTWKNILIAGMFLVFHILFSFPYYLVYLPVHTIVLLAVFTVWHIRNNENGFGSFIKGIVSPDALKAWMKVSAVLGASVVIFGIFYVSSTGGSDAMSSFTKTSQQLEELALAPTDYLMPHPRSTFLKGNFKESYWDEFRPGKNPDSFVAYIGYIAILLMLFGLIKAEGRMKWFFIAGTFFAFLSTLGPKLFGIPTPSGLIFSLYAPFARRILIYKVFVQMCVAGLAGMGLSVVLRRFKSEKNLILALAGLSILIIAEYSIASSELSVNLKNNPELYDKISALPEESILFELPARRNNGNSYQGYVYYQTIHRKKLFNSFIGVPKIPEDLKPFYTQMDVPLEACDYANLAALKYLGVTHLTYHWYIGTTTVGFGSLGAPALYNCDVEGLNAIFRSDQSPQGTYPSPFDYTFADLHEITAEPCPVALIYDYHSPYDQIPGVLENDFLLQISTRYTAGWASAMFDSTASFYYPLIDGENVDRVLKKDGKVTAVNMSGEPFEFNISFSAASPDSGRVLQVKWNDREIIGTFEIGQTETKCIVETVRLEGNESGTLNISTESNPYLYEIGDGGIPAGAVLRNFRVIKK
ncbi:hypothetical protein ACFL6P_03850 [Candidatus Latescibacterota bacterium]